MSTDWRENCRPSTRKLIQLYSALLHNAHLRGFIDGEIYQGKAKYACVPGFNCYSCPGAVGACPLGALQNALAATGHRAGWYIMGILLLFGTVLGRTICGWLCPMGLIQELMHKVPTFKIKKSRVTRLLSYLKYVFLAYFVIAIPLWYGLKHDMPMPGFCKYICPAGTLEGAVGLLSNPGNSDLFGMLGIFFTRKFVILVIIGLACIFCYRSFCRFICPLGAIYGLFNRFCLVGVKVDLAKCNGCGNCVRHCGMDVKHVGDHECIHCAGCMDVCAQKAISLKAGAVTLKAPSDTFNEEEQKKRRNTGRTAWGIALAALCFALVWFNFLDPAILKAKEPEPPGAEPAAVQSAEEITVGFEEGQKLEDFTINCFDGSAFTLSEKRGKVTFINLWATYCTPCVKELPHFDALYREHRDDIAVLAVHSSVVTDDPEAYLADKDYEIPFAIDTEDDKVWGIVNGSSTLPQTIVLDRDGVVIYNRKGAITPEVLEVLYRQASSGNQASSEGQLTSANQTSSGDQVSSGNQASSENRASSGDQLTSGNLLSSADQSSSGDQVLPDGIGITVPEAAAQEDRAVYLVIVTDEEGMPVPGVTVQFCSDTQCIQGVTDAAGTARFDREAGAYTIHIFKSPEGFAEDDTEYDAPLTPGTTTIVLRTDKQTKTSEEASEAASGGTAEEEKGRVADSDQLGLHYVKPDKYLNAKGTVELSGSYLEGGIVNISLEYYAVSREQIDDYLAFCNDYFDAYVSDSELPEPPDPSWMSGKEYAPAFKILAISNGRGEEELRAALKKDDPPYFDHFAWLEKVWSDGDNTFFVGQYQDVEASMDKYREVMGDYYAEFEDIFRDKESLLSALTFRAPVWPRDLSIGDVFRFETTDLDGNPVRSETLFAESKVTMVNIWGTWCVPCKRELPDLAVMDKEFESRGCRVIGICNDAYKDGIIEKAKGLLTDAGVEYPNLVGSPEIDTLFHVMAYPATYFVDSEGRLLLEPIFGADLKGYRKGVEEALSMVDQSRSPDE